MMTLSSPSLDKQIADAVGRTISARQFGETTIISLPVMYPSGAFAGVHVTLSGDRCYVSDAAIGLREAEMAGVGDLFDSSARSAAEWFGVGYDGASIFAASAPLSRIEGAVIAIANASSRAVTHALLNAAEKKDKSRNNLLFDKLREYFGQNSVAKTASIVGKDATWDAHNVVIIKGRQSVFEYVSQNTNSIASKFLMFSDISKTSEPPVLNSVVDALDGLGKKGVILGDVSNIVPIEASRERYLSFTRAA